MSARRVNLEGYTDESGFHPIRSSKGYNEFKTTDVESGSDRKARKGAREIAEWNEQAHRQHKARIKARTSKAHSRGGVRSLAQFVRARGGMTPGGNFAGEVRRLGFKETGTTGLINQHARQGSHKQTPEYVMDAANADGYGPFDSVGDFILAVEADATGQRKYYASDDTDSFADEADNPEAVPFFCALCERELDPATALPLRDGRVVCPKCAAELKRKTESKRQRDFFVEQDTLFNPMSTRTPRRIHAATGGKRVHMATGTHVRTYLQRSAKVQTLWKKVRKLQTEADAAHRKGDTAKAQRLITKASILATRLTDSGLDTPVGQLPNGMFDGDAVAKARQVTRTPKRRESPKARRTVVEKETGQRGYLLETLPGGWLKVQWDNRQRPTIIKRSELRRARNPSRPVKFDFGYYKVSSALASKLAKASPLGKLPREGYETEVEYEGQGYWLTRTVHQGKQIWALRGPKNPGLIELAGGLQAVDYLLGKAAGGRKRNPIYLYEVFLKGGTMPRYIQSVNLAGAKREAREKYGSAVEAVKLARGEYKSDSDLLDEWIAKRATRNPSQGGAGAGATSSDVRSPTRTSTEVRSPTKTSTVADTRGNITVTGGAGAGATTKVIVRQAAARKGNPLFSKDWYLVDPNGSVVGGPYTKGEAKLTLKEYPSLKKEGARLVRRRSNPSPREMSERFQGAATGSVRNYYASDSAPRLDFSRAGRLVFLRVNGKQLRIPYAVVAIDPVKEKLWIASAKRGAMLSRKAARKGEALDFGEIDAICYLTAKTHIGSGKTFEYVHAFGEEGGRKPRLLVDHEGMPILRGGDYRIRAEGIVD